MRLEIGNWVIEKAKSEPKNDKVVPIRMIANRLKVDRENQEILPQAFNKATVNKFLKNGIIDWHHQSVAGKTPENRAKAIIGQPTDFAWEKEDGANLPVVYGNLTKNHPIVRDSILPHLEAQLDVFGASIGGNIKKAKKVHDPVQDTSKDQISEIYWDHIAIAGRPYVISNGSKVSLCKAVLPGSDQLAETEVFQFADVTAFEDDHELISITGDELRKALTVGAGTDIATLTGADALRYQTKQVDSYSNLVSKLIKGMDEDSVAKSDNGVQLYLKSEGLDNKARNSFMKKFRTSLTNYLKNN